MHKKRIASHYYTNRTASKENGFLYAKGQYPTRLLPNDLPDYFVMCSRYGRQLWLDAKNIKHLVYKPCFSFDDHFLKDDALYISYHHEIGETEYQYFRVMQGYDCSLWGWDIVLFLRSVLKYSDYNTSSIVQSLCQKHDWYIRKNPDHAHGSMLDYLYKQ